MTLDEALDGLWDAMGELKQASESPLVDEAATSPCGDLLLAMLVDTGNRCRVMAGEIRSRAAQT